MVVGNLAEWVKKVSYIYLSSRLIPDFFCDLYSSRSVPFIHPVRPSRDPRCRTAGGEVSETALRRAYETRARIACLKVDVSVKGRCHPFLFHPVKHGPTP